MVGFLLVGLGPGIPVLGIIFNVGITSDKGFAAVNSDDFDDFSPLVDDITFLISLDYGGLNVIKVVDSILHVDILVELYILGVEHFFGIGHFINKSYIFCF